MLNQCLGSTETRPKLASGFKLAIIDKIDCGSNHPSRVVERGLERGEKTLFRIEKSGLVIFEKDIEKEYRKRIDGKGYLLKTSS